MNAIEWREVYDDQQEFEDFVLAMDSLLDELLLRPLPGYLKQRVLTIKEQGKHYVGTGVSLH